MMIKLTNDDYARGSGLANPANTAPVGAPGAGTRSLVAGNVGIITLSLANGGSL